MKNNYFQYTFEIPEKTDKDIIISILNEYEFEGFLETETGFVAYISEENDNQNWQNEIFSNKN